MRVWWSLLFVIYLIGESSVLFCQEMPAPTKPAKAEPPVEVKSPVETAQENAKRAKQAHDASKRRLAEAQSAEIAARRNLARAENELKKTEDAFRKAEAEAKLNVSFQSVQVSSTHPASQGIIDQYLLDLWKSANLPVASLADDTEFCRRVYLDIVGTIPDPQESAAFIADKNPQKRAILVDRLLDRPRYADYWALRWRHWIIQSSPVVTMGTNTVGMFQFLRTALVQNSPYHQWVRDFLIADGHQINEPAASFVVLYDAKPGEIAAGVCELFLGVNIRCAQCHDDTINGWTQEDFWGMSAFFSGLSILHDPKLDRYPQRRLGVLGTPTIAGGLPSLPGETGEYRAVLHKQDIPLVIPPSGEHKKARLTGPKPLQGELLNRIPNGRRRHALADWCAEPNNPYFDRAIVNRYWIQLVGPSFVPTVDGFQPPTKVEHEKLLDALARDFREHRRDLKHLLRTILLSRAYQLELARDDQPVRDFRKRVPIPLDQDQWHDSMVQAVGIDAILKSPAGKQAQQDFAYQLKRSRESADRTLGVMSSALLEQNGLLVSRGLSLGMGWPEVRSTPTNERVELLFRRALCRLPSAEEKALFDPILAQDDGSGLAWKSALWTLVNSTEFMIH